MKFQLSSLKFKEQQEKDKDEKAKQDATKIEHAKKVLAASVWDQLHKIQYAKRQ